MGNFLQKQSACPICASANIHLGFQAYYWRENLLDFFDCTQCGATFANPMPSSALISKGNDALVRFYDKNKSEEQEFRDARQAYLRGKMFAKQLSKWKPKGKLLELGCYNGFFSLGVKENCDWEVTGLEISSELGDFVQKTLKIPCYVGTFEEARVPKNHFDFVVCHDLIEHINDPEIFLRQLSAVIAPGGRVQIITPNGNQDLAFNRRAYEAKMPITMLLNHIMFFRPRTLQLALKKAGLSTVKIYCYDVRHALKDFGFFGMGQPENISSGPSLEETLALPEKRTLAFWSASRIEELRRHKKTSNAYGFWRETLPKTFQWKVPPTLEIGHEIYALAEKR